ncbi:type II secretion system protein N [Croceicoccus ponticola]|uniref:type II secretion system protein N n=1 Tax=Croceicoccus ponticola TaxID=2217664 RepID=UPI0013E33D2D|nr:type II secretion system protein N [Croceicoccus ponticola]
MRFVRTQSNGLRLGLPGLHDILWWLIAIGIVVAGVQLFWIAVTPVTPLGEWKPARVRLMDDSARSALMTGFDPFNRDVVAVASGPGATVAVITDLPLTLFGIRINTATGGGTAIVAGADGEQMVYRIGEDVMEGVTLSALAFDHVTLSRGGSSELLYLDQSKPAPTAAPASTDSVVPPAPAAPPPPPTSGLPAASLQQGIGFTPGRDGVAITAKGDGSIFRNAGLRSGDVLVSVNGKAVSGQQDLASFAGQVRPGSNLSLVVRRKGREVPLKIPVSE